MENKYPKGKILRSKTDRRFTVECTGNNSITMFEAKIITGSENSIGKKKMFLQDCFIEIGQQCLIEKIGRGLVKISKEKDSMKKYDLISSLGGYYSLLNDVISKLEK